MCAPCSSWRQRIASWRLYATAPSSTAGEAGCGAWQPRLPLLPLPLLVCARQKRRLLPTTTAARSSLHLPPCPACPPVLPGHCRYFICDAKLAVLGWQERTPGEVGLRKTVDWYLAHAAAHWDSGE